MPPLAYGTIDDELEILHGHMVVETMNVLVFFLSFLEFVTTTNVHNMLALILDPRFKRLKCVIDFFGHDKVKLLVTKYDNKILIPFLVICSHFLNPHVTSTYTSTSNGPSNSLFNIPISNAKKNEGLI